ncbi:hypothetical protein LTR62_000283 [Meristemomyces frigidus]|uniref:Uncharacterized protein n=1 Tax=Meristemomyces frigidus TaxID=1508187 RepID=A0AAN7TQK3_9PEZI|nr:hypothetical protein LTR62_000283 [Meristemomyces frigidus]
MNSSKRQKIDRETTAAYAASQPLFNAIRNAATKAGEQKLRLERARDLVQTIHVRLVDVNENDAAQTHEQYMVALIRAWASATEAYHSIFEELCNVTAADASEGRQESDGHEHFKAMAESAATAHKTAMAYTSESRTTSESTPVVTPGTAKSRKRTASNLDETPFKTRLVEPTLSAEAKRVSKRTRPESIEHESLSISHKPVGAQTGKENSMPTVEFEDVSAEVAARLRTRAEKYKAKRQDKKRKRESGESVTKTVNSGDRPGKKKLKSASVNENGTALAKRKADEPADCVGATVVKKKRNSRQAG